MKWLDASADYVMDYPAQVVWEFVSNVENMGRWIKEVKEPNWTSEYESGLGSTFASQYEYAGKTHDLEYEVIAYEPPTKFATKTTAGRFPYQGTITIKSVDGKTKVTHDMMAGSDGAITAFMFTVGAAFFRPMMRKRLRKELETMSEEIRKGASSG